MAGTGNPLLFLGRDPATMSSIHFGLEVSPRTRRSRTAKRAATSLPERYPLVNKSAAWLLVLHYTGQMSLDFAPLASASCLILTPRCFAPAGAPDLSSMMVCMAMVLSIISGVYLEWKP